MGREASRYRHSIRVRYGEVDQQGVVYNSHYMVYADDALENWLHSLGDLRTDYDWDMMLKKCSLEWQGSAAHLDVIDIDLAIIHWGRSSWTVGYVATCRDEPVFTGEVLYVSVGLGTNRPMATPDGVRRALGEAVDLFADTGGPDG